MYLLHSPHFCILKMKFALKIGNHHISSLTIVLVQCVADFGGSCRIFGVSIISVGGRSILSFLFFHLMRHSSWQPECVLFRPFH